MGLIVGSLIQKSAGGKSVHSIIISDPAESYSSSGAIGDCGTQRVPQSPLSLSNSAGWSLDDWKTMWLARPEMVAEEALKELSDPAISSSKNDLYTFVAKEALLQLVVRNPQLCIRLLEHGAAPPEIIAEIVSEVANNTGLDISSVVSEKVISCSQASARRAIVQSLLKTNPQALGDFLTSSDVSLRESLVGDLRVLDSDKTTSILDALAGKEDTLIIQKNRPLLEIYTTELTRRDKDSGLEFAMECPDDTLQVALIAKALKAGATPSLGQRDAIEALLETREDRRIISEGFLAGTSTDRLNFAEQTIEMTDPEDRVVMASEWLLDSVDNDSSYDDVVNVVERWSEYEQGTWEAETGKTVIPELFKRFFEEDQQAAMAMIASLEEGIVREIATSRVAELLVSEDPMTASALLRDLPASEYRDRAVVKMLDDVREDYQTALSWAETLSDDDLRNNMLRQITENASGEEALTQE